MTKYSKALWFTKPNQSQILKTKLPENKTYCEVKALYSCISVGTERLVLRGEIPSELYQQMICPYMEGDFLFPIKYGYSLVGVVVSDSIYKDSIVHLLHPHQQDCIVNEKDIFCIPQNIPPQRATLASNVETAINAVWDANIKIGEKILIVGFGIIGSLLARIVSGFPGIELIVYDIDKEKIKLANQMGFSTTSNLNSHYYDVAFHCSANQEGLQIAIDCLGFEGKVIETSWYGKKNVEISLGTTFHSMRKKIISSQVSNIPSHMQARWDFKRRKELVFSLLSNPLFDQHLTHEVTFDELPGTFDAINTGILKPLACVVRY